MKTAVEWLAEKYNLVDTEEYKQAKELEKQQITKAFDDGFKDNSRFENPNYRDSEQYYEQTFKK
jgi:hypothetical protein